MVTSRMYYRPLSRKKKISAPIHRMMKIPAAEGAAKFLYAIAKSTLRWRTASAIASTAIAQAFKKKKHMTASSRAVKVDFRTVYSTEGRGWSVLTDGMRISFTRIDVIGAFYSALRLTKRIAVVQFRDSMSMIWLRLPRGESVALPA